MKPHWKLSGQEKEDYLGLVRHASSQKTYSLSDLAIIRLGNDDDPKIEPFFPINGLPPTTETASRYWDGSSIIVAENAPIARSAYLLKTAYGVDYQVRNAILFIPTGYFGNPDTKDAAERLCASRKVLFDNRAEKCFLPSIDDTSGHKVVSVLYKGKPLDYELSYAALEHEITRAYTMCFRKGIVARGDHHTKMFSSVQHQCKLLAAVSRALGVDISFDVNEVLVKKTNRQKSARENHIFALEVAPHSVSPILAEPYAQVLAAAERVRLCLAVMKSTDTAPVPVVDEEDVLRAGVAKKIADMCEELALSSYVDALHRGVPLEDLLI